MQVIVYTNSNGGISVTTPSQEALDSHGIEWIKNKDTPQGSIIMDDSELPIEQEFFNAWELIDGKVVVNESKKEVIQKNQCSVKAKELLISTDWAMVSDVGLKNQADFVTYRGILRGLATSPVANPSWPTEPIPVWQ